MVVAGAGRLAVVAVMLAAGAGAAVGVEAVGRVVFIFFLFFFVVVVRLGRGALAAGAGFVGFGGAPGKVEDEAVALLEAEIELGVFPLIVCFPADFLGSSEQLAMDIRKNYWCPWCRS